MCLCPHWSLSALDAIDHTLFSGCSSPLVTLLSLESHFVISSHIASHLSHFDTFCHILTHILSSSEPFPAFCEDATKPCLSSSFTPFLPVSWSCSPGIQIYLIMSVLIGHRLACLFQTIFILSKQWSGDWFSDRTDWRLGINSSHHQHIAIVNISHCCLFLKAKSWKWTFLYPVWLDLANPSSYVLLRLWSFCNCNVVSCNVIS